MEDYLMHSRHQPKYYAKEGKGPNALYFYSAHAYRVWQENQLRQKQKTVAEYARRRLHNAEHDTHNDYVRQERARKEQMHKKRITENAEHDAYNEQKRQAREAGILESRESTQPIKTTLFQFVTGTEAAKGLISAKREMKRNAKDIKRAEKRIAKLEDTLTDMKAHRKTRTPRYAKLQADLEKQYAILEQKQKVSQPLTAKFNAAMNYYTKATLPGMLSSDLKTGSKKISDILAKSGNSLLSTLNPTIVLKKKVKDN